MQNRLGASGDRLPLGAGGSKSRPVPRRDSAREAGWGTYAAPQLRQASTDEWHTDQLPVTLAGALVDPDDAHLPELMLGSTGVWQWCQ